MKSDCVSDSNDNEKAENLGKSCKSAVVPLLDHLTMSDYDTVYEPSDDTFLMLDALAHEFDNGDQNTQRKSVTANAIKITLEIGCGTGVNTIFLAQMLKCCQNPPSLLLSLEGEDTSSGSSSSSSSSVVTTKTEHHVTDINKDAIRVTLQTAQINGIGSETISAHLCDLATPLLPTLRKKVDVLIFNPPYVPTPDHEVGSDSIEASWAGGTDGRIVLDRALPQIASLLSWPNGVAYVITVDDNKPDEIINIMMLKYGILGYPLVRRRARNEYLTVLKFEWASKTVE